MNKQKKDKISFKKNEEIIAREVRVISEEGSPIMPLFKAIKLAEERNEDVILINEKAVPPIVKIVDYGKHVYQQKKNAADIRKNSQQIEIKEVRLSVNIDDNDLNVKAKQAQNFLQKGNKVKVSILMKGRQMIRPEQGQITMLKFAQILEDISVPESMPNKDGKKWLMVLKPKKTK